MSIDATQRIAKAHFTSPDGIDGAARVAAARQQIEQSRNEGNQSVELSQGMMANLASMGAQVEIVSLAIPQASNRYIGVSMYCDGNAQMKQLPLNQRATELARTCGTAHELLITTFIFQFLIVSISHKGYADMQVLGDVFVSRYYDNESSGAEEIDDWKRESIAPEELSLSSSFVKETAKANAGRNMGSYTSSGSLAKGLQQLQGGGRWEGSFCIWLCCTVCEMCI